ncbi:MAG: tRNA 4-thiouridine(8) synthase ThiI [Dehalococcoidia bacterium]|nr:tRNA 4-thiouridine(8) synthase ThiI [Dehalococcoidia bacterium]
MRPKAIGLLSGGLDSVLAIRLVMEQGIEVVALHVVLPFVARSKCAGPAAEWLGIRLVERELGEDFVDVLRNPKYGYGKGFNPCIDCHLYMLRMARQLMEDEGADFVVTGDVLKQRPKSQTLNALGIEDKWSGLKGLIVRPLSGAQLAPTLPEAAGVVDRARFLSLIGKNRKPQLELARDMGLTAFSPPAGGCALTNREFGVKARTFFSLVPHVTLDDLALLRWGRHFYRAGAHIVVGKDRKENSHIMELRKPDDVVFRASDVGSPIVLLRGEVTQLTLVAAAQLTAVYSDTSSGDVANVKYFGAGLQGSVAIEQSAGEQGPANGQNGVTARTCPVLALMG